MTKYVMKSLKLNPDNPRHKKAINALSGVKNSQELIVKLLIEYGKKNKSNDGDLFDDN